MDWWIGAFTPFGNHWYAPSQKWIKSSKPISFGQIPLYQMPSTSILNYKLPVGLYSFFFILDDNPNNSLDKIRVIDDVMLVSNPTALTLEDSQLDDFRKLTQEKIKALVKE